MVKLRRWLAATLIPAVAFAQQPPEATSTGNADSLESERVLGALGARLDSMLSRFADGGFAGTVLVVRDNRVVLLKGYGFANIPQRIRNHPATRFEMNSITKMFTGAAVLQLDAAGKLRLDDPLSRHLGPFPASKRSARVRHLAAHTAGLVRARTDLPGESRDAFVRAVKAARLESKPGEDYRYTNAGYSLLAAVIERASRMSYEDYLRRHIFAPVGMRSAIFRSEVPPDDTLFARGYVGSPNGPVDGPPNPYMWGTIGAGGVWSTVGDIYRWVAAVEKGSVIPARHRKRLFSAPPEPSEEAFGWHVYPATKRDRFRISKGGGSADFASQLLYFPDDRVVIVWANNDLSRRWRQTLNERLVGMIFGESTRRAAR